MKSMTKKQSEALKIEQSLGLVRHWTVKGVIMNDRFYRVLCILYYDGREEYFNALGETGGAAVTMMKQRGVFKHFKHFKP